MGNFVEWMQSNWAQLLTSIGLFIGFLGGIAKFTPTPKDDAWVARLLGWFNLLPKSAKDRLALSQEMKAKNR